MTSDLASEQRYASTVAKRLESLGALTQGDRHTIGSRDFSQFHFDNEYGLEAVITILDIVIGSKLPVIQPPADYKGEFFKNLYFSFFY